MLRKRHIIETINDILKNTAQLVHSRHWSVNNFIMSMISALAAYCFFDNKPQALEGYYIEGTKQLMSFRTSYPELVHKNGYGRGHEGERVKQTAALP